MQASSSSLKATNAAARSLRAAEQCVVSDELSRFEVAHLHATPAASKTRLSSLAALSDSSQLHPSPTPAAAAQTAVPTTTAAAGTTTTTRANRKEQTQRFLQAPFTGAAVHGDRSALMEGRQVHDAAAWLRECPSRTLQLLQQRVLCATETLFTQLVGMPAAARALLDIARDPNERRRRPADGSGDEDSFDAAQHAADAYLTPPPPLSFADFLANFIREPPTSASAASGPVFLRGVLLSGRPQPAAPLSSLHLVYGLHVVEDVLRAPTTDATSSPLPSGGAAGTSLEAHQALLSEVVHWATFFEDVFDNAREGLCRDPLNFYVAVLLACAERGAWELHHTPEAIAEEAVRHLQLEDSTSGRRPHLCTACRAEATHLAESCRTYVRRTLRTMQDEGTVKKGQRQLGRTRFFLATPAVVWWAAAFLRLYRLRNPVVAAAGSSTGDGEAVSTSHDVVSSAEVYFIRDWIAQAAKMDHDGFREQEKEGCFSIPLSCATDAAVAVFAFTPENVEEGVRHISAWADSCVASNTALSVQELLTILQDDFAVVPYYWSYFKA